VTNAELFEWRDAWLAENPWFEEACAVIAAYERVMRTPVVIITQHWRDGVLVKEEREVMT
jgi:hypothetical protein